MNKKDNPADVLSGILQLRMTPGEKRQLKQMTRSLSVQYPGMTMSGLARHCIFGKGVLSELRGNIKSTKSIKSGRSGKKKKKKR